MRWPYLLLGLATMEAGSYLLHRYAFHGPLWFIHRTHHLSRRGWFEANDVFSLGFGLLAAAGVVFGAGEGAGSRLLAFSLGITLYGLIYFALHDLATHRRIPPLVFTPRLRLLSSIIRSHRRHHQTAERLGQEPFGFLVARAGEGERAALPESGSPRY